MQGSLPLTTDTEGRSVQSVLAESQAPLSCESSNVRALKPNGLQTPGGRSAGFEPADLKQIRKKYPGSSLSGLPSAGSAKPHSCSRKRPEASGQVVDPFRLLPRGLHDIASPGNRPGLRGRPASTHGHQHRLSLPPRAKSGTRPCGLQSYESLNQSRRQGRQQAGLQDWAGHGLRLPHGECRRATRRRGFHCQAPPSRGTDPFQFRRGLLLCP